MLFSAPKTPTKFAAWVVTISFTVALVMTSSMVVVPATCLIAAAAMAVPFAPTFPMFLGAVGAWACGATMLGSTPTAYVSDVTTPKERAQALALLRSAGDVGLMIGASVLVSLLAYSLSQIDFIPIVGDWAAEIASQIVEETGN